MQRKKTSLRAKILLAILSPIVFLGLLELGLNMVGAGHPTTFTILQEFEGKKYHIANPHFTKPWFPGQNPRLPVPFGIPVKKPANSLRVLILGASAAQGDPKPEFGFSRMLDRMLSGQLEDRHVEVYNFGITAINSHVVKAIAKDSQALQADYWIVYLGNNEVIGPLGPANPGSESGGFRTTLLKTQTGQMMSRLLRRNSQQLHWSGMEAYLKPISWGSPELENVYSNFEQNVTEIFQHGQDSGAQVLLSTVAVNLRTCSPLHPEGKALQAWEEGEFATARDQDTYRFRADSQINDKIRQIGKATEAELIDIDQNFTQREAASPAPLFLDHVHFTLEGNNILALLLGQKILELEKQTIQPPKTNPTIGFTKFDRQGIAKIMKGRLSRPPFLKQQPNGLSVKKLTEEIEALQLQSPEDLQAVEQNYLNAISFHPEDPTLRLNYSTFLLTFNQAQTALKHCRKAIELAPWNPTAYYNLALALAGTQSPISARDNLKKALELSPNYSRAHALLGSLLAKSDPKKALHHFNESVRIEPDDPQVLTSFANYLLNQSESKKADLEKAYQLSLHACKTSQFSNPQAVMLFVSAAKKSSQIKEAISSLEEAADISSVRAQKDALRKYIEDLK